MMILDGEMVDLVMMLDMLDDDSEQEDGGLGAGEGDDGKGRTSLVMSWILMVVSMVYLPSYW